MSFVHHSLMILEDAGMSVGYPDVDWISENGVRSSFICDRQGRRVSIDQNPHMKLMMLFSIIDFHVDSSNPGLEGSSFRKKYLNLPSNDDYDIMFRELFRLAKLMRNALVHSPSSLQFAGGGANITYTHQSRIFRLSISGDALDNFFTAAVMYLKGDLGRGNYFLGMMRSIYSSVVSGITAFDDDFGATLASPPSGLKIRPGLRLVHSYASYQIHAGVVKINAAKRPVQAWEGLDFHILLNGDHFLVPYEALSDDLSVDKQDLVENWRRSGSFPEISPPSQRR